MGSILGYVRRMKRLVSTKKGPTPSPSQGSHDDYYYNYAELEQQQQQQQQWVGRGCVASRRSAFVSALSAAGSLRLLPEGRRIHCLIIASGGALALDAVLETAVLSMYAKCGCLVDARAMFDGMRCRRDAVSWSAMIVAYARKGYPQEAMHLFGQMKRDGFVPGTSLILFLLNTFTDKPPPAGVPVKEILESSASTDDVAVNTALANMYAKHGFLGKARSVFDQIPHHHHDLVSWSTMISAYARNGLGEEALHLFWQMDSESVKPDKGVFLCLLSACANMQSLRNGKEIHKRIIASGFESDIAVSNGLLNMYGKCGDLAGARAVFHAMPQRDAASWNAMIAACQLNGCEREALALFEGMESEGVKPNRVTFLCLLNACARMASLEHCEVVHKRIIGSGFETDPAVRNALVNVYGKCGSLEDAYSVFDDDNDDEEEAVSWNSLLATYSHNGLGQAALRLFGQMDFQSVKPNKVTFLCVLDACSHAGLEDEAWKHFASMHNEYYQLPPLREHYMCMIDLLVRAGCIDDAKDWIKNMPVHTDAASRRTFLAKSALGSDNCTS